MGRTKYGFETTSTRSNIMSKIRSKDTKPELGLLPPASEAEQEREIVELVSDKPND